MPAFVSSFLFILFEPQVVVNTALFFCLQICSWFGKAIYKDISFCNMADCMPWGTLMVQTSEMLNKTQLKTKTLFKCIAELRRKMLKAPPSLSPVAFLPKVFGLNLIMWIDISGICFLQRCLIWILKVTCKTNVEAILDQLHVVHDLRFDLALNNPSH